MLRRGHPRLPLIGAVLIGVFVVPATSSHALFLPTGTQRATTITWIAATLRAGEKVKTNELVTANSRGKRSWAVRGACALNGATLVVRSSGTCSLTLRVAATSATGARTMSRQLPIRKATEINVLAAASLSSAFDTIAADIVRRQRHLSPRLTFAGSSTLATQVRNGAPMDVVAMADTTHMTTLTSQKLVTEVRTFARNRLAILTAKNNPLQIRTLQDLTKPNLTVVLCDLAQPCGRYANDMLTRANLSVTPASRESSISGVITRLQTGEADAGIGYASDAASNPNVSMVPIPVASNVVATYPIGVATSPSSGDAAAARSFVSYVMSPAGQRTLTSAGFITR